MAYTALNIGYTPQAGYEYTATTDSNADWPSVPNDTYFFDLTLRQVFYKDANGLITSPSSQGLDKYTFGQTQWSKIIPTPVNLPNGTTANGFTFFDNVVDKVAAGTTAYDQYDIGYSISITLSGTSGTANINVEADRTTLVHDQLHAVVHIDPAAGDDRTRQIPHLLHALEELLPHV